MTTYTDAEIGAAFRVVAAVFHDAAVGGSAPSAATDKTSKGSAGAASGASADKKAEDKPPSEPEPTPGYSAEELTTDNVIKRVLEVGGKKGRDAATALLTSFKNAAGEPCARASEIVPEDFVAALDAAKEALASG